MAEQAFPFEWHYHKEYELLAVTSSRGTKYVGDHISGYGPGDIVLIGPYIPHAWRSIDDSGVRNEAVVVKFAHDFIGRTFFEHAELGTVRRMLERSARGLEFMGEEYGNAHSRIRDLVQMDGVERLLELLGILVELSTIPGSRSLSSEGFSAAQGRNDGNRINAALKYMHDNMEEQLTQSHVAESVHMSPSGLSRLFKRCTGRSYVDCLNDMRIKNACSLLADTDMTVSEICYQSGFRNLSNFNRRFLRMRKMSPREYRKLHAG